MFEALRYSKRDGLEDILLESDSLRLVKCLRNSWKVPWERIVPMEECRGLVVITKAKIQHTLRDGNNLADFTVNRVIGS
ncbi:hypothetical protein MTR67_031015 [Solanum verrucosum]|uniref:RNase H type-1 domain-containing protein n=1 Tax=Solanum verrucosum TaxID=315347 RepID=A0AAF0U1M7_SOLVR|nr:hypothetical protein MTR67_031015 [Solanum verrucosum]